MSGELDAPWNRGLARRKPKYVIQEEALGKKQGSKQQPNSGRLWSARGDVLQQFSTVLSKLLIDAKGPTEHNSYRITRPDWLKLRKTANTTPPGCLPALQITLQDVHLLTIETALWDHVVEHVLALETANEELNREIRELRNRGDAD